MSSLYDQVESYVSEAFASSPGTIIHLKRTARWARRLKPDADEVLLAAALSHDIERSNRNPTAEPGDFLDPEYLRSHQEGGADMMREFLAAHGASSEIQERVAGLIARHEVGGTEDQSIIMNADSLSFFENNVDLFLYKKLPVVGEEAVRRKFEWMYDRIDSSEAKGLCHPYYQDALRRLDNPLIELFDWVDESDTVVGTTTKERAHQTGELHRVAAVLVFDHEGRLQVQVHQRDQKLDHSVGGHISKDEGYDEGAKREAFEELGITTPLSHVVTYLAGENFEQGLERHFFGVYECTMPKGWNFASNEEVKELVPMHLNDVAKMMADEPQTFTAGFRNTMMKYFEVKKMPYTVTG
jgi:isopentenyl-diphosphate delta-isomerase